MRRMAIIGGGPAAMMAAILLSRRFEVHLYEKQRNLGRKFLVAGEGGFNLTNELDGEALIQKYTPQAFMRPMIEAFGSNALREWLRSLGVETYVGSSRRVFPAKGIKPVHVLDALRSTMLKSGVTVHVDHRFTGFDQEFLPVIEHKGERVATESDRYFFALGGASWPGTGSDGVWSDAFRSIGVPVLPFRASNCGLEIDLPPAVKVHAGKPLKNVAVTVDGTTTRGECLITDHGLEGNIIYPTVPHFRERLGSEDPATLILDLKPDVSFNTLFERIASADRGALLSEAKLDRPSIALLKAFTVKEVLDDPATLAAHVKALKIVVRGLRPLAEAISTVGGIPIHAVNKDLSLIGHPHLIMMGEMIDWDAPTGGFLLQGTFSTAHWAVMLFTRPAHTSIGRNSGRSDE